MQHPITNKVSEFVYIFSLCNLYRPQSRVLGRSILHRQICEQPNLGLAVGHPGQETSAVAGCVWDGSLGATVWVLPELWLGYSSQADVGTP